MHVLRQRDQVPLRELRAVWCTVVTWWERGAWFSLSVWAVGEDAMGLSLLTGYISRISKYNRSTKWGRGWVVGGN